MDIDPQQTTTSTRGGNASEARHTSQRCGKIPGDAGRRAAGSTTARRPRPLPKPQLFDLVAGGALERAIERMGRQEDGEVSGSGA